MLWPSAAGLGFLFFPSFCTGSACALNSFFLVTIFFPFPAPCLANRIGTEQFGIGELFGCIPSFLSGDGRRCLFGLNRLRIGLRLFNGLRFLLSRLLGRRLVF